MRHTGLLWLLLLAGPPGLPPLTVEQVRRKGGLNAGVRVVIWAFREGAWKRTDEVDAAEVQWERLLADDRVEVVERFWSAR